MTQDKRRTTAQRFIHRLDRTISVNTVWAEDGDCIADCYDHLGEMPEAVMGSETARHIVLQAWSEKVLDAAIQCWNSEFHESADVVEIRRYELRIATSAYVEALDAFEEED